MLEVTGLPLGTVARTPGVLLGPAAPPIDRLVSDLLATRGVRIGEADVGVYGVTCTGPVLVG